MKYAVFVFLMLACVPAAAQSYSNDDPYGSRAAESSYVDQLNAQHEMQEQQEQVREQMREQQEEINRQQEEMRQMQNQRYEPLGGTDIR